MDSEPWSKKWFSILIIVLFLEATIFPITAQTNEKHQCFNLLSSPFPPAKRWMKTYGGIWSDCGYSIKQTTDDGYIIAGTNNGSSNAWLLKIDSNGNPMWERTYNGIGLGRHAQQTTDGSYIMLGDKTISNKQYIWLMKTDDTGNRIWNTTYNRTDYDEGLVVQQTTDGGYFIVANAWSSLSTWCYYWLLKTNSTGQKLWEKTFGGTWHDVCYSGQQTTDGGFIITGCTTGFGGPYFEGWLIKTDSNGDEQWNRTFEGTNDVIGKAVQQTTDGGYIVAADFCWEDPRIMLIKTDNHGNTTWEKILDTDRHDYAKAVEQTIDGGYIIIGQRYINESSFYDFLLIKTDGKGSILWERTFGNSKFDEPESGQVTTDGGYVLLGNVDNPGEWSDLWVVKTDEYGYATTRPNTPTVTGKINGAINTSYDYSITTIDPDNDNVQYFINWGDNSTTITGFNASGKTLVIPHTWMVKGTYTITAKAIDENSAESDWATLTVTMPCFCTKKIQHIFDWLFQRFSNAFSHL